MAVVGLLRLGWIAEFLSFPIITGFLAGVAVIIFAHQSGWWGLDRVVIGSGRNDRLYELAPSELLTVCGAAVADLAGGQRG